jgi:hypothetical protein
MRVNVLRVGFAGVLFGVACGGALSRVNYEPQVQLVDGGEEAPDTGVLAVNKPSEDPAASEGALPTAEVVPVAPSKDGKKFEQCIDLGRFPATYVTDAGAEGNLRAVPWMSDPMGNSNPPVKAGAKGGTKKSPAEKSVEAMQTRFRACYAAAKRIEAALSVGIELEHKPKGGKHAMCIRLQGYEGRDTTAKDFMSCMLQSIQVWAKEAPGP